jgi:copper resistance protein B
MRKAHLFRASLTAAIAAISAPAAAQHGDHSTHDAAAVDHSEHLHGAASADLQLPPVTDEMRATAFPDLADMRMSEMMLEDPLNKLVLFDRLEQHDATGDPLMWDLDAWFGRTLTRVWVRSEGEQRHGTTERNELTVAWGKGIARWWDVTAGARRDFAPGGTQTWAAFGIRGLAPYRFDVAATAFVGEAGRTAFRVESSYEILVTNRLILTPTLELDWHGRTDAARAIGAGLGSAELGLRLRYEFRRQIAPYVGLMRERRFGRTAELAGAAEDTLLVAGLRLWF